MFISPRSHLLNLRQILCKKTKKAIIHGYMQKQKKYSKYLIIVSIIGFYAVCLIAFQASWPGGISRPFLSLNSQKIGLKNEKDLVKICVDEIGETKVIFKTDTYSSETAMGDIGLGFDCKSFAKSATTYPLTSRLVPFSIFATTRTNRIDLSVKDSGQFEKFAKELTKKVQKKPVNAKVVVKNGKVSIANEKQGTEIEYSDVANEAKKAITLENRVVRLKSKKVAPDQTYQDLEPLKQAISNRIKKGIRIIGPDQQAFRPSDTELGSWVKVKNKDNNKTASIQYDAVAIENYIKKTLSPIYFVAPINRVASFVDDKQVGQTNGRPGQIVDVDETRKQVSFALDKNAANANITLQAIAPQTQESRRYSTASKELLALLRRIASTEEISISAVNIDRNNFRFDYRQNKVYTAASTYKLFVAYSVMKRVDAKQLSWNQSFAGTTIANCFDKMIVISDNDCSVAFLRKLGYGAVAKDAHSIGSKSVSFVPNNMQLTAADLSNLLTKLAGGSIVSSASKKHLFSAMEKQIFRNGIPSGTSYLVKDKVGFLYGLIHDAGIVYTPSGRYVVIILTDSSSWSRIAQITKLLITGS